MNAIKKKRSLFEELAQGIKEINQHIEDKITLKTYRIEQTQ